MIDIQLELKKIIKKSLNDSFNYECNIERISIDTTPKNFEGFYTFIIFPHIKYLKCNNAQSGPYVIFKNGLHICPSLLFPNSSHPISG